MSNVTVRNLAIATLFLLGSLGVFGYGLFIIEKQNADLADQITALATDQAQEASFRQMQRTADESTEDRARLDGKFLAEEGDSIDYLNTVETLAREAGLQIVTNELSKNGAPNGDGEVLNISFTFTGSYGRVTDFLEVLENLKYVAEIQTVELSRNANTVDWVARVRTQVNLYSYEN